jgi:murein L,D-transpeptidase YcbB/YkuD
MLNPGIVLMDRVTGVSERLRSPGWRREAGLGLLCLGLAAVVAAFAVGGSAHAQAAEARWWEGIPGFGAPGHDAQRARPRSEPQGDPLNDLRADAVPWRSDVMVEAMDRAIERYQRIAGAGGWPQVPGPRMIRPGDDDERVPVLRRRLRMSGDLARGSGYESYTYDGELEAAVRRFQARHGLRVSGRVDQPTFAALNVSAEARLAQLKLNRGRIVELLGQRVEDRYVLVNVPAFQLEAVERHEVALRHRVIVGRTERQTPTLKATIRALNFFPYWRVPESVATLDLIPRLRKEPEYLVNEKIRVFNGHNGPELDPMQVDWNTADGAKLKFKQDPGQQNALGLVRIDMANEHGVYMHDTPLKKLFEQRGRAFSAGCVRVQGVFELVEWIARGESGWDQPGRVDEVIASGQALDLNLTRPIPVYFAYITAWAEPNGRVEFRPDLYGRDGARDLAGDRDPDAPPPPSGGLAP